MFRFERLEVWRKSGDFADIIYQVASRFPPRERFGLTSQLTRAATSISANIAEGSSRSSDKDFSRYVEIAYGSLCESISHLFIAKRQGFICDDDMRSIYVAAEELGRMLTAFRNTLGKWKSVAEAEH